MGTAMTKFSIALALASAFAVAPFPQARAADPAPTSAWSEGGLVKMNTKGLDVVYAKPGASLAEYHQVLLHPISVSFSRNWEQRVTSGTSMRISAADSQRIKDKLSALLREEVAKQLNEGGYKMATSAGDDVLDVTMAIVNLYVTAPDVKTAGVKSTYAVSAGEMSLVVELRDSVTGDVIARAFDRALARESFRPMRITSVDNAAEARAAAKGWAEALRKALDRSKGIGAPQ
jgi:hypothetical protein